MTLTGIGPDANGNGQSHLTWNDCSFDGTNTNCTLSGPFTGLGPGGTWNLALAYPGNGPSPATAITAPGSDLFSISLSSGRVTWNFNESNGTSVTFYYLTGEILFVAGQTSCTGNPPSCAVGSVGQTPGAAITGLVNGMFNPLPQLQTVITAGSYGGSGSIAPATWIEIYGLNVGTTLRQVWGSSDFHGSNAPTTLAGTTVTVGGQSAFVDYVSPGQVNAQAPSNIGTGQQPVVVTTAGGSSDPFNVNVNATQPGLLAPPVFDIHGTQYVVALFPNQSYVLPPGTISGVASKLAVPGDTILLYGVGFGGLSDDTPAGVIDSAQNKINASFTISIGGAAAQIAYSGLTPGFVGLYQFNVVVPNIAPNDQAPLTFSVNGTPGTQTLYLAIGN
jgi:uncharacterized protein (TIGR03437 family)